MNKNGKILIVEDRVGEKIGCFFDDLEINEFDVVIVETYEEADEILDKLLKENKLDGIILDFSFPISKDDKSDNIDEIPNGVVLLKKYLFNINNKRIPLVINTTGDNELKNSVLNRLELSMPLYIIDHENDPLANRSSKNKKIIDMFQTKRESRKIISKIEQDKKWWKSGPFLRDKNGKIIGYRE